MSLWIPDRKFERPRLLGQKHVGPVRFNHNHPLAPTHSFLFRDRDVFRDMAGRQKPQEFTTTAGCGYKGTIAGVPDCYGIVSGGGPTSFQTICPGFNPNAGNSFSVFVSVRWASSALTGSYFRYMQCGGTFDPGYYIHATSGVNNWNTFYDGSYKSGSPTDDYPYVNRSDTGWLALGYAASGSGASHTVGFYRDGQGKGSVTHATAGNSSLEIGLGCHNNNSSQSLYFACMHVWIDRDIGDLMIDVQRDPYMFYEPA